MQPYPNIKIKFLGCVHSGHKVAFAIQLCSSERQTEVWEAVNEANHQHFEIL